MCNEEENDRKEDTGMTEILKRLPSVVKKLKDIDSWTCT
jgi:hypothetical protein